MKRIILAQKKEKRILQTQKKKRIILAQIDMHTYMITDAVVVINISQTKQKQTTNIPY